jgi:uncharacterized protein (TIGR03435 family)
MRYTRIRFSRKIGARLIALLSLTAPALTVLLRTPTIQAQSQSLAERKPSFDVVSIKRNDSGNPFCSESGLRDKVGRYRATNATLSALIASYFGLKSESQIAGGPAWLDIDRFDIEAGVEGEPSRQELTRMAQSLLEDRFQLRSHRESRESPVLVLLAPKTTLKFGPHLAQADDRECPAGSTNAPGCRAVVSVPRGMAMEHIDFAEVAQTFSTMLHQVVIDETGLPGNYDIKLDYDLTAPAPGAPVYFPEIITDVLRTQTGLRLETMKRPVDMLVIDHVEMPSEN